jgi:hypothetical protein
LFFSSFGANQMAPRVANLLPKKENIPRLWAVAERLLAACAKLSGYQRNAPMIAAVRIAEFAANATDIRRQNVW